MVSIPEWHKNSAENLQVIQTFHENYARQPDMTKSKEIHTLIMKLIELKLKEKIGCAIEMVYTGSAYDGLKTGRTEEGQPDDLEFDIMVIIGKDICKVNQPPGLSKTRVMLTSTDSTQEFIKSCKIENDYISPQKVLDKFYGCLTQILETTLADMLKKLGNYTGKIRRHGPAVQLDIFTGSKLYYSVDIVPTMSTTSNSRLEYFVAKPGSATVEVNSWRRSFSVQEKNEFAVIDSSNGCCKKLLRILKVIFKKEATLKALNSYHLKTIMLHLMRTKNSKEQWKDTSIFDRFIDFMRLASDMLNRKLIPHFYVENENLIAGLSQATINNISSRIDNIATKKAKFTEVFAPNNASSI